MKKFATLFMMLLLGIKAGFAADMKNFSTNADNLFAASVSAIEKLNYKVSELQANSGYILFSANGFEYLLSVTEDGEASCAQIFGVKLSTPLNDVKEAVFAEISSELTSPVVRIDK